MPGILESSETSAIPANLENRVILAILENSATSESVEARSWLSSDPAQRHDP